MSDQQVSSVEIGQLYDDSDAGYAAADALDELDGGDQRSAGGDQVVNDQYAVAGWTASTWTSMESVPYSSS